MDWNNNTPKSAPENVLLMTKIDDERGVRNEWPLYRQGRLWFNNNSYVYWTPTHWRELTGEEKLKIAADAHEKSTVEVEQVERLLGLRK